MSLHDPRSQKGWTTQGLLWMAGAGAVIAGVLVGGSESLAEFVVPAAPNLAHVVFFIVGAMCAGSMGRKAPA